MTERDREVLEFIANVEVATTSHIQEFIFKDVTKTVVSRRLNTLVDYSYLKRARVKELNNAFVYYSLKKPNNLIHELIATQLYIRLNQAGYKVTRFLRNKKIGSVIPDVVILIEDDLGNEELLFVEIQRGFNPIFKCLDKYETLLKSGDYRILTDTFPRILLVTDQNYNKRYKNFKVLKTNTNCDNLNKILKGEN